MWTDGRQNLFLSNPNESWPLISQEIIPIDPECNQQFNSIMALVLLENQ